MRQKPLHVGSLQAKASLADGIRRRGELDMTHDSEQLDLNFGATVGNGYESWQWEQKEALRRVSLEWGLPLGKLVRVRFAGIDGDSVGILRLQTMPRVLDRNQPLKLRMGRHVFDSTEIESCSLEHA